MPADMQIVTQFRSEAGNTFDNEHDAHKDDLRHWLCEAAGNDPIARQVAERANADLDALAAIVADMKRTAPVTEPELPLRRDMSAFPPLGGRVFRALTPDGW